ncbi:MAG: YciI family protein [Erythrobacter sp.]
MRVLVLVKATADSEAGVVADPAAMAAMGRFNDALREAGVLVFADGLKPSSAGARVRFDGAQRTVRNGPFLPPEEQVAGLWLWDVKDMDEAIAWAKRCPNPMPGPSEIEIRPFFEPGDIG